MYWWPHLLLLPADGFFLRHGVLKYKESDSLINNDVTAVNLVEPSNGAFCEDDVLVEENIFIVNV